MTFQETCVKSAKRKTPKMVVQFNQSARTDIDVKRPELYDDPMSMFQILRFLFYFIFVSRIKKKSKT